MINVDIKSNEGYYEFSKCVALALQGETAGAYSFDTTEPGRFIAFHGCAIMTKQNSLPCLLSPETLARIAWDWLRGLRDADPDNLGWRVLMDKESLVRVEPYEVPASEN